MPPKKRAANKSSADKEKAEASTTALSSAASTPNVAPASDAEGVGEDTVTSPQVQPGPDSLVAQGIVEHEEQVDELRDPEPKEVDVNVHVDFDRPYVQPYVEGEPEDREFVYVQHTDERRTVPGTSQYLDDVERQNAEVLRAKVEGREPDLERPPSYQGSPLVDVRTLPAGSYVPEDKQTLPVVVAAE